MTLMLAHEYNPEQHGQLNAILMPKLNGVRARFIPGQGWFSRDGKAFSDGKFKHIDLPRGYEFDGELYVHGWPLQRINAAVSVNSDRVDAETAQLEYWIYDLPGIAGDAFARHRILNMLEFTGHCRKIVSFDGSGTCQRRKHNCFMAFVAQGYEGMMLKTGLYEDKRSWNLLKMKAWKDGEFPFEGVEEGLGKRKGMVGKIICRAANGKHFKIGTGFSDELAMYWFVHKGTSKMPVKVKVQYIALSDSGIPLNCSFLEGIYDDRKSC